MRCASSIAGTGGSARTGVTAEVKAKMTRQIQEKHPLIQVGLSMANVHFSVSISGVPLSGFGEMDSLTSLNSPKYIHHTQKQPTGT